MKRIRTLLITFGNDMGHASLSAFRGAVVEKVGREHQLFHNHAGDEGFIYGYPLIQYKKVAGKHGIFCIDDGVDAIHKLFEHRTWQINLNGQKVPLRVDRLDLKQTILNVWERKFDYHIWNWQALNEVNWHRYQQLDSMAEKIAMLEKILVGNILSFAKGVEWRITQPLQVAIRNLKMERNTRMKDVHVRTFAVDFRTNVYLPDYMGLGKGVSKGFGVVRKKKDDSDER